MRCSPRDERKRLILFPDYSFMGMLLYWRSFAIELKHSWNSAATNMWNTSLLFSQT